MPNDSLYQSYQSNAQLVDLLQQFDGYDQPCFFLVHTTDTSPALVASFLTEGLSFDLKVMAAIALDNHTLFVSIDLDKTELTLLTDETMAFLTHKGYSGRISAFRHNALGDPERSFKMALIQLQDAIEAQDPSAFAAINDFTDTANWPGYERYKTATAEQEEAPAEPISGDEIALAKALLPFEMGAHLANIAPFVFSLPCGDPLWRYVLTGEGRQQLDQANALVDLDHVLVYLHAKNNAPGFFKTMGRAISLDSVPSQDEMPFYLDDMLAAVASELLESDDHQQLRQGIYLRILDIFFHLFDQMPLDQDIFQRLVEDENSAFLSETEFAARFRLDNADQDTDELTPEQERSIRRLLRSLESYYSVDSDVLRKAEALWQQSRNVCNPELWDLDEDEIEAELLLAALFLALDAKHDIDDDNTEALSDFINDQLFDRIIDTLSHGIEHPKSLPDTVPAWLQGADVNVAEIVAQLQDSLSLDYRSDREDKQPIYDLMEVTHDFSVVLASAYWVLQAENNPLAQRLIRLFLVLAPQASLSCFARLYGNADGVNGVEEHDFYPSLAALNIEAEDIFAFRVRQAKAEAGDAYLALIQDYLAADRTQQVLFDKGLQRIEANDYQRFYVDLYLTDINFDCPVADEWQEAWAAMNHHAQYFDEEAFVVAFAARLKTTIKASGVLFADHVEMLPAEYELPFKAADQMRAKKADLNCSIVRCLGDQHEVLVGEFGSDGERLRLYNLIVLDHEADTEAALAVYEALPSYPARTQIITESLAQYLAGDIAFAEYQQQTQTFVDTKKYGLEIDEFNRQAGSLLAFIRIEKNTERQLRYLKVLTAHPTLGRRLLAEVCFELYLDQACRLGSIRLQDRYQIDQHDLGPEAKQSLAALQQSVQQQLAAMP